MRILFQGDSITDTGRSKDNDWNLGIGYANLVSAHLGYEMPGTEFFNRGISGNRVVDVYARMKKDILNLKPDVMSILIGVNDVWHDFAEQPNGVDAEKYFKIYSMLIEEIKEALPNIKIMILEPFLMKYTATEERFEEFYAEVRKRADYARKIAEKFDLPFIELQDRFDAALEKAPVSFWSRDGVHPIAPGHEIIKRAWLEAFAGL